MQYTIPEKAGVSSRKILEYIRTLQENRLNTHSLIISKGDKILFEGYWEPFHKDRLHRMYSVSKSFVSLAVGFLEQEGKLSLDDPIKKYFPKEAENPNAEVIREQTIRQMLMMSTAKKPKGWFAARCDDRVALYFDNDDPKYRPPGTVFEYDSSGSFVLGAMVERITGKPFMEYLREKLFCKIGVSAEAHCLRCPGGHSWGDSAILCTPMDLWKTARFTLNMGSWNGEQILNEDYVRAATSKQIDNNLKGIRDISTYGYGYQFWRTRNNSFFFNGMGCQLAVCSPDSDMIVVYNGDNQGMENAKRVVIDQYFRLVEETAQAEPLPEDPEGYAQLQAETANLKLSVAEGALTSAWMDTVQDVTYRMNENPMGIRWMKLRFAGETGCLEYENAQGKKCLPFGLGYNEMAMFPEEGYSDQVGSVYAPGHYYRCAASAGWVEPHKLRIQVQIIDDYFGILNIMVSFRDSQVGIYMDKTAEDFLQTYQGIAAGTALA